MCERERERESVCEREREKECVRERERVTRSHKELGIRKEQGLPILGYPMCRSALCVPVQGVRTG